MRISRRLDTCGHIADQAVRLRAAGGSSFRRPIEPLGSRSYGALEDHRSSIHTWSGKTNSFCRSTVVWQVRHRMFVAAARRAAERCASKRSFEPERTNELSLNHDYNRKFVVWKSDTAASLKTDITIRSKSFLASIIYNVKTRIE